MSNISASRPAILIDFKKNRIRLYKRTLHAIGNPEYILLLINPEDRTIAILSSDSSDLRSYRLPKKHFKDKKCFELHSKSLMSDLLIIYDKWQDNISYRINGEIVQSEGIAQFSIDESVAVSDTRGQCYG